MHGMCVISQFEELFSAARKEFFAHRYFNIPWAVVMKEPLRFSHVGCCEIKGNVNNPRLWSIHVLGYVYNFLTKPIFMYTHVFFYTNKTIHRVYAILFVGYFVYLKIRAYISFSQC